MASNQNLVAKIIINAQDNASKAFQSIQENAGKLAAGLAALVSFDVFKSAVTSAADFEAQLDIVAVKTGVTGQDLEDLKNKAVEIGTQFGKTGTEALTGMEVIASAGYSAADAISLLPSALDLADNSGKSLTESSSYLIKIMQSLGLETKQAGNVTDILTVASSQANTKVGDLTDALLESGGTAKTFGLGIKETAAILDVLASAGKSGAEAGTSLRNILLQVSDPTSKASEAFQKLGINSTDLVTVFKELATKGQAGKDALLALNTGDIAAANGILENIGSYDKLRTGLDGITGKAHEASDALGDNTKSAFEDFGAIVTNLGIQLGTPILKPFKNSLVDLQAKIQALIADGTLDKIGQSLASAFQAGVTAFSEFAKTIDFTTIGDSIKGFAIKTALTFDEISAGAKAIGDTFSLVTGATSTFVSGLQTTAASMLGAVSFAVGGVTKSFGDFLLLIGKAGDYVPGFNLLGDTTKSLGEYFSKAGQAGMDFASALKDQAVVQANESAAGFNKASQALDGLTESATKTAPKISEIWTQSTQAAAAQKDLATETDKATAATNSAAQAHQAAAAQMNSNAPKWVKHIDDLGKVTYENVSLKNSTDAATQSLANSGKGVNDLSSLYTKQFDELGRVTLGNIGLKDSTDKAKQSTDNLTTSIGAIPNKESKITADTTQATQKIEALKPPTDSLHTVKADAQKPKDEIGKLASKESDTISVHTFGSNPVAVNNDISRIQQDTGSLHTFNADNSEPLAAISHNQQPTSSNHTIYVTTVQTNQNGGQIQHFANGGQALYDVNFQRREGGLGGFGGGDTVPAMLEPGEWIIKKESVKKYGDGFMAKLNAGQIEDLPKFSFGGRITDDERYLANQNVEKLKTAEHFSSSGEQATIAYGTDADKIKDENGIANFKGFIDIANGFYTTASAQGAEFSNWAIATNQDYLLSALLDYVRNPYDKSKMEEVIRIARRHNEINQKQEEAEKSPAQTTGSEKPKVAPVDFFKTSHAPESAQIQSQPAPTNQATQSSNEVVIRFVAHSGSQATANATAADAKSIVDMIKQASLSS